MLRKAFGTEIIDDGANLIGPWRGPRQMLAEQVYDDHVLIHDDATAQRLERWDPRRQAYGIVSRDGSCSMSPRFQGKFSLARARCLRDFGGTVRWSAPSGRDDRREEI
jgi:hypothetical protein